MRCVLGVDADGASGAALRVEDVAVAGRAAVGDVDVHRRRIAGNRLDTRRLEIQEVVVRGVEVYGRAGYRRHGNAARAVGGGPCILECAAGDVERQSPGVVPDLEQVFAGGRVAAHEAERRIRNGRSAGEVPQLDIALTRCIAESGYGAIRDRQIRYVLPIDTNLRAPRAAVAVHVQIGECRRRYAAH